LLPHAQEFLVKVSTLDLGIMEAQGEWMVQRQLMTC